MNRFIIRVHPFMNNHFLVPNGTEVMGRKVFTTSEGKIQLGEMGPVTYIDCLVTNELDDEAKLLPPHMVTVIPRPNKEIMAVRVNRWMEVNDTTKMGLPLPVYKGEQESGISNVVNPKCKVVIKPMNGARGVGQLLVDFTVVPFISFMQHYHRYTTDKLSKDDFIAYVRKYQPDFDINSGVENYTEEGKAQLDGGFTMQKYVGNIDAEYRLMTDYRGDVVYCQRRIIETSRAFPQASAMAPDREEDIIHDYVAHFGPKWEIIKRLITEVAGPMNSIDLFTTKTGHWGIFEYSNQFDVASVPYDVAIKIHTDFFASLIRKSTPVNLATSLTCGVGLVVDGTFKAV